VSNERQQRAARAEQMRKEREKADRKQRNLITVAIVVVVIALIAVAFFAIKSTNDQNKKADKLTTPRNASDDYSIVYTPEDATGTAPETEPVVVELYEDFLCPGCGAFEQANKQFLTEAVEKGEISIAYRPFTFLLNQSTNEYSQRASNAAACVLDKGGVKAFVAMHDILFANQPAEGGPGPEDPELIAFAEQAGVTGIDTCVKSQKFGPWVEKAYEAGVEAGVSGTPTVRIDGKDVNGPESNGNPTIPQPADLQKAIDAAKA
jgi:protein-disulfide isomerase